MNILLGLLAGLLLLASLPILSQNKMIYFPSRYEFGARIVPGKESVEQFRTYRTRDGREQWGIWLPPVALSRGRPAPRPEVYLVFGGNASTALGLQEWCERMRAKTGAGFFLADYRGYGFNDGKPSERGLVHDALGAYDTLAAEGLLANGVGVMGQSLGGGVAFATAAERDVDVVMTFSTFSSIDDIAKTIVPWPIYLGLWNHWPNERRLAELASRPATARPSRVLLFHALRDEIVPYALGEKLAKAGEGYAEFVPIDATHNDVHEVATNLAAAAVLRGSGGAAAGAPE